MLITAAHPASNPLTSTPLTSTPLTSAAPTSTAPEWTPLTSLDRARARVGRTRPLSHIDATEVRLRRLVASCEPAVVFSSLVRLCVPTFSDICSVDIVEGARMGYRIGYPQRIAGETSPVARAEHSLVTAFESDLPGWAAFTGVMTCLWHTRRPTIADEYRAAAIIEHAVRVIRSERLSDRL